MKILRNYFCKICLCLIFFSFFILMFKLHLCSSFHCAYPINFPCSFLYFVYIFSPFMCSEYSTIKSNYIVLNFSFRIYFSSLLHCVTLFNYLIIVTLKFLFESSYTHKNASYSSCIASFTPSHQTILILPLSLTYYILPCFSTLIILKSYINQHFNISL